MRFPPPFRERHRRDNVGGLEEENDKKTVVVILEVFLSLSFTVVYCAEFCGVSRWNNNNVSVSRLSCTYAVPGRQRDKKSGFSSKCIHSRFHSSLQSLLARRRRISLLFVAFFFDASQRSVWCIKFILHISAREALDTPPREAGIPSLARETRRLIIFARGFFGEEDKETGSFRRERHIPTRIKSEKIIRVGHFLARKYLLSVRPRGPRTSRQQAQCVKKYISIPKKNLEKDLYVRACARASKKTKTKNAHLVG